MAVGDIYRVTLSGAIGANLFQIVNHYAVSNGLGTPAEEAEALAKAYAADVVPVYVPMISNQYATSLVSVRGVTTPTAGYDEAVVDAGETVGEVLPYQDAVLVNWRTAKFGRSFRGKTYIGPIGEAAVSNGSPIGGFSDLVAAWFLELNFVDGLDPVSIEYKLGVYSQLLGEINPVTTYQISTYVATQRRRKPGVGA
jgi:hypothetical protein